MDFVGKICPYCKTELKADDDVVVCSVCEMPHHKECWIENKACTTFGCTGTILGAEQLKEELEEKFFCSKCGKQFKGEQKFCTACGNPKVSSGGPRYQVSGAAQPQNYTAYSNPSPYQADEDMNTFIQSNQAVYVSKFQKLHSTNVKTSWNWCSFLFGGYWLAYRKMYGFAVIFEAVSIVCGFIPVLGMLMQLALKICSGVFGDYFYKQYVEGELKIAKTMDAMNKNIYMLNRGGTNVVPVIFIFIIEFVISIMMVLLRG